MILKLIKLISAAGGGLINRRILSRHTYNLQAIYFG